MHFTFIPNEQPRSWWLPSLISGWKKSISKNKPLDYENILFDYGSLWIFKPFLQRDWFSWEKAWYMNSSAYSLGVFILPQIDEHLLNASETLQTIKIIELKDSVVNYFWIHINRWICSIKTLGWGFWFPMGTVSFTSFARDRKWECRL